MFLLNLIHVRLLFLTKSPFLFTDEPLVHFPANASPQNTGVDFLLGGCSAVMAGTFTNPVDLIKTRQQLHGELVKRGREGTNPYATLAKSARTIIKYEGIAGIQRGLVPALGFQFVMNSTRLGLYETGDKWKLIRNRNNEIMPVASVLWGGICGLIGSAMGTPFYMVKTQLQAMAPRGLAVGHQHHHRGTVDALVTTFKSHGVQGLFHGVSGMMSRTAVGSAVQLTSFSSSKDFLAKYEVRPKFVIINNITMFHKF